MDNKDLNSRLLLEETDTLGEKMEWSRHRDLPQGFDFYLKNGIKRWADWQAQKDKDWKLILEWKIRSDLRKRMNNFENVFFPKWIQAIKDYQLSTLDRAMELKKQGKDFLTNEKQPIIYTYVNRLVQATIGSNFTIKCYPLSEKNTKKTRSVQKFIERCFSSSKARKALSNMVASAALNWVWYARTWFNTSVERLKEIKDPEVQKLYNVENYYAQFEWVSEFSILWDPFNDFYDQREIIYRSVLPIKSAIKKMAAVNTELKKEHLHFLLKTPRPFLLKNYEKVRLIKYYEDYIMVNSNFQIDNLYQLNLDNSYCEYVEYRSWKNLVLCINWYVVYDWPNPRVTKTHPFKVINFSRMPWVWIADWAWTLLAWQQRLYDALYNITFDLIKFNAWPMFLAQPWQAFEWDDKVFKRDPFSIKQVRWPWKLEILEMPKVDPMVTKTMNDILMMSDFAVSPTTYNQLWWVSRSATDSQLRYEWLKDSIKILMESINNMLTVVAEEWIVEARQKMPKEFSIMIMWENWQQEWETIKTKDLVGKYIFEFESESIKDINKVIERWQFGELMKMFSQIWTDPATQRRLVKTEELLANWLQLFNQPTSMIMNSDEYYKRVEDARRKAMEINAELQKYQQTLMQPQFDPEKSQEASQDIQYNEFQKAKYEENAQKFAEQNANSTLRWWWMWSNYADSSTAVPEWIQKPAENKVDLASIMKQINE